MVELLKTHNIIYEHFDVTTDTSVRNGIKTFSNFPTFPQLYRAGALIGGLDIVEEMFTNGETL